jgi:hypothetical protein
MPRPAGVLAWTGGAVALHAAVPFRLSRPGGPARPASAAPAVRTAGLVTVAAGGALMAWALAAHYRQAPQGWPVEPGLMPGYLLRRGPYRLVRNPRDAGEAVAWAGWGLVYASPAVRAGLASWAPAWRRRCAGRSGGGCGASVPATGPTWPKCRAGCPATPAANGPGAAVFAAILPGRPARGPDQAGTGSALGFRSRR